MDKTIVRANQMNHGLPGTNRRAARPRKHLPNDASLTMSAYHTTMVNPCVAYKSLSPGGRTIETRTHPRTAATPLCGANFYPPYRDKTAIPNTNANRLITNAR